MSNPVNLVEMMFRAFGLKSQFHRIYMISRIIMIFWCKATQITWFFDIRNEKDPGSF